jgi:hypothetical protein
MIPWKTPTTLLGSLLCGVAFAVGHHVFYSSLQGSRVSDNKQLQIGHFSGVTSQAFNIAVGTALAFCAKAFLGIAATTAWTQCLFRDLRRGSPRLGVVDSAFSLTSNPFKLLSPYVWYRFWPTAFLALLYW